MCKKSGINIISGLCFQKQSAYLCGMLSGHYKTTLHYAIFLLMILAALPALSQTAPSFRFKTIVIDPGHGGKDPGAHGAHSNEKTIALSIGKKLKEAINGEISGVDVIMTRTTDKFIELHKRAAIANDNKANLFISIHCNSSPGVVGKGRGVLLLVYGFHRKAYLQDRYLAIVCTTMLQKILQPRVYKHMPALLQRTMARMVIFAYQRVINGV